MLKHIHDQGEKLAGEYDPLLSFAQGGTGDSGRIPVIGVRRATLEELFRTGLGTDLAKLEREIDQGPKPQSREIPGWRLTGEITVIRKEADVKNVLGVLEGEGPLADETIIVGAHYDHLGWAGRRIPRAGQKGDP